MNFEEAKEEFKMFDANGDGKISEEGNPIAIEVQKWAKRFSRVQESEEVFLNILINCITRSFLIEYISACRKRGNEETIEALKEAFNVFDTDSDGHIDFDEYLSAMQFIGRVKL